MVGIVTYGSYIPIYRIKTAEIARMWGDNPEHPEKGLGLFAKSVPAYDEDAATIAVEALRNALRRKNIPGEKIGAIFVGSESHPYAVKPTASLIAEVVGAYKAHAADLEFACKAGTAAMQNVYAMVKAGMIDYGVAIGTDTSQGQPGDALDYSASAGGTAYIIGKDEVIAEINHTVSFVTDTPDFWRREGQRYPSHGGRFTGEPAYFKHIMSAARMLMEEVGTKPEDYDYVVFHQPNGKFPYRVGKRLGFTKEQIKPGLVSPYIGNTYSGGTPTGLSTVLDIAKPGDRIIAVSFGSGAGSDAFDITVTDEMENFNKDAAPKVWDMINRAKYIDYATYLKFRRMIVEVD
ncbi:hydroxymethylglutaryl-CoA synthase [Candidatus Aciduliprofundum boonei]|uniref:Hydroxymethylglutaryl-CoA synthase n=1 Tax=Aciduliprofundum boonei (strain DSM 19572 / T469) TaxID=439481 RepID=D3TC64_ACIB4|nr:hydroxymethylglutaryl-CoA synthase [Candidatus Aciduliprofundum boonei]ADD08149.1 hydroxymethylglutaryl-CoA synthase [Aciduliprofundum boonei T469]HII54524.1 hydroxymethylglutaryl-CoA synthase [Candidatus Aciduliprofundum boonei]